MHSTRLALWLVHFLSALSLAIQTVEGSTASSWLGSCVGGLDRDIWQCSITADLTLELESDNESVLLSRPLVIEGVGWPTLNLSGGVGVFTAGPGIAVSLSNLQLVEVALDQSGPVTSASFLSIRALDYLVPEQDDLTTRSPQHAQSPGPPVAAPPRLYLENITINTGDCTPFGFHQAFACAASPSPNFTVTPDALVVHSYTSGIVRATNVTLRCSSPPGPCPCLAASVGSGAELLALLESAANGYGGAMQELRTPINILLSRSFALWSTPPTLEQQQSSIGINALSLVISGGSVAAASDGTQPPIALDLSYTTSLFSLTELGGSIELHNLTLVNLPLAPPRNQGDGFLTLLLWTFSGERKLFGTGEGPYRLVTQGVAVQLLPSELALWHMDLTGSVPQRLATYACASDNNFLRISPPEDLATDTGQQWVLPPTSPGEPTPGVGLFLYSLSSTSKGAMLLEGLLLTSASLSSSLPALPLPEPAAPAFQVARAPAYLSSSSSSSSLAAAAPASAPSPSPTASGGSVVAVKELYAENGASEPLCQLRPEGYTGMLSMRTVYASSPNMEPWEPTPYKDADPYYSRTYIVISTDTRLRLDAPLVVGIIWTTSSFQYYQAQIVRKQVLLGFPMRPRRLHMSYAPSAINVRSAKGTLTVRQLVISGLPAAGLHPTSAAWSSAAGAGATGYGDASWDEPGKLSEPSTDSGLRHRRLQQQPTGSGLGSRKEAYSSTGRGEPVDEVGLRNSVGTAGLRHLTQASGRTGGLLRQVAAGDDPTGGLNPALANFTSCLWSMDFDRGAFEALATAQPYRVFLDSVVLLVPPGELALMAWAWAEHLIASHDSAAAAAAAANDVLDATSSLTTGTFEFVTSTAGALSADRLSDLLQTLRALPQTSQLMSNSDGVAATASSLERLTTRLLAMEATRQRQMAEELDPTDRIPWWQQQTDGAGGNSTAHPPAYLTFSVFTWCGLRGRNVTLAAEPLPGPGSEVMGDPQLWSHSPMDIPLQLSRRPDAAAAASPSPPRGPSDGSHDESHSTATVHSPRPSTSTCCRGLPPAWPSPPPGLSPTSAPPPSGLPSPPISASHPDTTAEEPRRLNVLALAASLSAAVATILLALTAAAALMLLHRRWRRWRQQCRYSPKQAVAGSSRTKGAQDGDMSAPGDGRKSERRLSQHVPKEAVCLFLRDVSSLRDEMVFELGERGALDGKGCGGSTRSGAHLAHPSGRSSFDPLGCAMDPAAVAAAATADNHRQAVSRFSAFPSVGACGGSDEGDAGQGPQMLVPLGELGRGAQGVVYRGLWRGLEVAVKSVLFHQAAVAPNPDGGGPLQEAAICSNLSHAHVVATYAHQLRCLDRPARPSEVPRPATAQRRPHCPQQPRQQPSQWPGRMRARAPLQEELHPETPPCTSTPAADQWPQVPHRPEGNSTLEGNFSGVDGRAVPPPSSICVEPEVWRLTLIQELCDAGSLRRCLDSGLLAGCSLVPEKEDYCGAAYTGGARLSWRQITSVRPEQRREATASDNRHQHCSNRDGGAMPTAQHAHGELPPTDTLLIQAAAPRSSAPPLAVSLAVALQVARGMEYLHSRGVLHGDLSSANVLLQTCPKPGPPRPPTPSSSSASQPPFLAESLPARRSGARVAEGEGEGLGGHRNSFDMAGRSGPGHMQDGDADGGCGGAAAVAPGSGTVGGGPLTPPRMVCDQACGGGSGSENVSTQRGQLEGDDSRGNSTMAQQKLGCPAGWNPTRAAFRDGWLAHNGCLYGYGYTAKVADFGMSGRLQGSATHLSGDARRSWLYSAPELVLYGVTNKGTDTYAFAVLLYEIVTGQSLPALLGDPTLGGALTAWLARQQLIITACPSADSAMSTPMGQPDVPADVSTPIEAAAALPPSLLVWPDRAPPGIAALAADCLAADPAARPSFASIIARLTQLMDSLLLSPPPAPDSPGRKGVLAAAGASKPASSWIEWRVRVPAGRGPMGFKIVDFLKGLAEAQ